MTPVELARSTKTSVHTIRYYQRIGLLKARRNRANGYHEFNVLHIELLSFIKRCRMVGLPLAEIRACVDAAHGGRRCCPGVGEIIARALHGVEAGIAELVTVRARMRAFVAMGRRRKSNKPTGADVRRLVESLGK